MLLLQLFKSVTHPKLVQLLQVRYVLNALDSILRNVQYLKFTVPLQILEHFDAIFRQIQLGEIHELIEIFNFGNAIVLQAETCELRELVEVLDFGDFILAEIELREGREIVEVFDFLKTMFNVFTIVCLLYLPPTHPDLVIPKLQHSQVCQRSDAIDARKFVRAQIELLQVDECIDTFDSGYPIEAEIQSSAKYQITLKNVKQQ